MHRFMELYMGDAGFFMFITIMGIIVLGLIAFLIFDQLRRRNG